MQAGFEIRKVWLAPFPKLAYLLEMMFRASHGGMGKAVTPSLKEYTAMLPSVVHAHCYPSAGKCGERQICPPL